MLQESSQIKIKNAESLQSVLKKFHEYVTTNFILKQKNFKIITFGSWELGVQLWVEARQKSINLAEYFLSYYDIIHEYRSKYFDMSTSINNIYQLLKA